METELQRIEVDGTTYQLRAWSYEDGQRWLYRLMSIGARAAGAGSDAGAVSALMGDLGEQRFFELTQTVAKYTDVVAVEDGRETIKPLSSIEKTHMQRRYTALARLIRAHMEAEFGDFFKRLGETFEGLVEQKAK